MAIKIIYIFLFLILIFNGLRAESFYAQNTTAQIVQETAVSLPLNLPNRADSVKFLAVGDTGRGNRKQNELAQVMFRYRTIYPFGFAIMTGDNIYYQKNEADLKKKFENVYRSLLDSGVKFYASLGNHDEPQTQINYALFNMNGREYYRFENGGVSFYAVNSVRLDNTQINWLTEELSKDPAKWKIVFFHHPPYSSGKKHGSEIAVRNVLEPIFLKHGVDVVFNGHDHFYERIKPQKGIYYFVTGAGGKIRKGNIRKNSPLTEKGYDRDLSFMLVEISGDEMHFQVISRTGETVDSGVIRESE